MAFARAILVVLVLSVIGAAAYFVMKPRGPSAASGLDGLAALAPQNTQAFLALDLRATTSTSTLIAQLKAFLKDSPQALKSWQEAEAKVGVTADQFSKWSTPAVFLVVLPAPKPAADVDQEIGCTSNLKNIATALEMYSTDFNGLYPSELATLTPNYLKTIPTCPAAQQDTYSATAQLAPGGYTLACAGHHHPAEPENFPQYNFMEGLITKAKLPSRYEVENPDPVVVLGFPVTDVALARTDLQKILATQVPSGVKPVEKAVGGGNFTFYDGVGYGFVGNTLLVGSTEAALAQVVASCEGKAPNLTTVPAWNSARQRVKGTTGALVFAPLDPLLLDAVKEGEVKTDQETEAGLKAVKYAAAQLTLEGKEVLVSGQVGVDPQSTSPFAKALLTSSNMTFVTPQQVPADWLGYQAIDVRYLYNVVLAGFRLFPDTRPQVDMAISQGEAALGFTIEGDIFGGFTGELAYASRKPATLGEPSGLLLLPLKDAKKAEKLLSKLDVVGWKAGKKVGDVQLFSAQGAVKATKGQLFLVAHGPEAEKMLTEALETKTPLASTPSYQQAAKDRPESWIQCSYVNTTQLKEALVALFEDPELGGDEEVRKLAKGLLDHYQGGSGLSWVTVDPDGLRLASTGQGTGELTMGASAVMAAILVPNFIKARSQGQLTACKSNLKNIGTALEMYSTDYAGLYPESLDKLTPNYLIHIPTCPSVGSVTYVAKIQAQPDLYTVICSGHNHQGAGAPADYPQYTSIEGLRER